MKTAPHWVTDRRPPIGEELKETLAADVRAERLKVAGLRGVSADRERARVELTEEERAGRSTRPPNGRRWRQLSRLDDAVAAAENRHAKAVADAQAAEEAFARAPQKDAEALARWLEGGEAGPRPESTIYELERQKTASRLLVDAAARVFDDALERRLQHVLKHKQRIIEDARKDVEQAADALREHVARLPQYRERLVQARATLEWCASFPDPVEGFGSTAATALGLQAPVKETLGTTAQLPYSSLLAAFDADASALAHAYAPAVAEKLGTAPQATPLVEAMWSSDERAKEWGRQELERARRLGEWTDPEVLGAEVREIRPEK